MFSQTLFLCTIICFVSSYPPYDNLDFLNSYQNPYVKNLYRRSFLTYDISNTLATGNYLDYSDGCIQVLKTSIFNFISSFECQLASHCTNFVYQTLKTPWYDKSIICIGLSQLRDFSLVNLQRVTYRNSFTASSYYSFIGWDIYNALGGYSFIGTESELFYVPPECSNYMITVDSDGKEVIPRSFSPTLHGDIVSFPRFDSSSCAVKRVYNYTEVIESLNIVFHIRYRSQYYADQADDNDNITTCPGPVHHYIGRGDFSNCSSLEFAFGFYNCCLVSNGSLENVFFPITVVHISFTEVVSQVTSWIRDAIKFILKILLDFLSDIGILNIIRDLFATVINYFSPYLLDCRTFVILIWKRFSFSYTLSAVISWFTTVVLWIYMFSK